MRLRTLNISKRYLSLRGMVRALEKVNLEVGSGELFVLLGPSGSGKSTLLKLVAGLERPSVGEIWFDDAIVSSPKLCVPPRERNVAVVFQSYALYPHLNVFENIAFPLRISKVEGRKLEKLVRWAAETMKISHLLLARPDELSGGEKQRVAIARAIVRKPNLFLLDEPLSNLDARLRVSMRVELKTLQRELQVTTLYVTHDQVEAMTLGDRIAVLKDGEVEQVGTPSELYDKPKNTFVATFVGSPPMSIFEGEVQKECGSFFVKIRDLKIEVSHTSSQGRFKIGVRPEHVKLMLKPPSARVVSVENLGREFLVHLDLGGTRLSAISESRLSEGMMVGLRFERIYILY